MWRKGFVFIFLFESSFKVVSFPSSSVDYYYVNICYDWCPHMIDAEVSLHVIAMKHLVLVDLIMQIF